MGIIQLKRSLTQAAWEASGVILAQGEPGLAVDTGETRYGDGTHTWVNLPSVVTVKTSAAITAAAADATTKANAKVAKGDIVYNVKDYGVTGNGATDDTAAIQALINTSAVSRIYFPAGTYMIDAVTRLVLKSNLSIELHKNATLQAITNGADPTFIMRASGLSNITITGNNSKIIGDRATHTNRGTGQSGIGIALYGCSDVTISGIQFSEFWADAIYIGTSATVPSKNIRLSNILITRCRRNAVSVISVDGLYVRDLTARDINVEPSDWLTGPNSTFDFEINYDTDWLNNIHLENVRSYNVGGCAISFPYGTLVGSYTDLNITINNCIVDGAQQGLRLSMPNTNALPGKVVVNDLAVRNTTQAGIFIERWSALLPKLEIIRPILENCAYNPGSGPGSIITIRNSAGQTWNNLGNISIQYPVIKAPAGITSTNYGFYVSAATNPASDIVVNSPRFIGFPSDNLKISHPQGAVISDQFRDLTVDVPDTTLYTQSVTRAPKYLTTSLWTAQNTIFLDNGWGLSGFREREITITADTDYGVKIQLGSSNLPPYIASTGGTLQTNQRNSAITLRRSTTGWVATNIIGLWFDAAAGPPVVTTATPQVDVYSTAGTFTWTKPASARAHRIVNIGAGSAGASGRRGAAGSIRCGGGGGAGGATTILECVSSDLTSTVSVTVGAGGTGGAAVTTDDTSGNAGSAGGSTTFGSYALALGGGASVGGTAALGTGGAAAFGTVTGNAGGAASTTGLVGASGTTTAGGGGAGGGGAGGGISSANVAANGGGGGVSRQFTTSAGAGGVVDTTAATAGPSPAIPGASGAGSGGGAASITTAAQAGAAAVGYGSGGGGGGASLNGNNSGAGGNGATGYVLVITYF